MQAIDARDGLPQLELAAILQCAEANGSAGRVFEFTLEYMFDRYSFGRPLASYQALKHRFADMKLWLECCYATADAAAEAIERRDASAAELASVAKSYVGDHTVPLIQECVQMHGGMDVGARHPPVPPSGFGEPLNVRNSGASP